MCRGEINPFGPCVTRHPLEVAGKDEGKGPLLTNRYRYLPTSTYQRKTAQCWTGKQGVGVGVQVFIKLAKFSETYFGRLLRI